MLKVVVAVGVLGVLVAAGYPEDLVECNDAKIMQSGERVSIETVGFPGTPYPNNEQ